MSEVFNVAVISSRINLFDYYIATFTWACQCHIHFSFIVCALNISVFFLDCWKAGPRISLFCQKEENKSKIICNAWSWAWEEVEWGWDTKHKITYSHVVYTNLISTWIIGNKEPHYLCSFGYYFGQIFIHFSDKVSLTVWVGTQTEADYIF